MYLSFLIPLSYVKYLSSLILIYYFIIIIMLMHVAANFWRWSYTNRQSEYTHIRTCTYSLAREWLIGR